LSERSFIAVNSERQRREGFEVEMRTIPVHNFSISAGATFTDATNRDTGKVLKNIPRYTYDVGLHFNDKKSFRVLLKGHYIWWNANSDLNARYTAMIWDLNLNKKILSRKGKNTEVFLTAHNIFNGSQFLQDVFRNPERWMEAGIRIKF
jgi:vitamin B12 transporter